MPRINHAAAAVVVLASLSPSARAWAEPARAGLIIGNATYTTLPPIPGCAKSANTVAAALRALGFQVTERQDASTGGIDAGIGEFSQRLAAPDGVGIVYICGYGTEFNDRIFVLPASAKIERQSDVLTQGVLAKSLLSTMSHEPTTVGVVVFDLIPQQAGPVTPGLDALAGLPMPDGVGIIATSEPAGDGPTPLAMALVAALKGPVVSTGGLLASVRTQLASNTAIVTSIHMPSRPGVLAGQVPPPAPPAPPPPGTAASTVPPSAATAPQEQLPDEAQMTDADRRKVQSALVRLGYYDTTVDGVFGVETRAAIRRYQHEIGGETTGHLTAEQATRLVNSH